MTDMQADARRVREHVLDKHLLAEWLGAVGIGECANGIGRVERAVLRPKVLPTDFDVLRKRRRVPMFRSVDTGAGLAVDVGVAHTALDPTGCARHEP